MFKIYSRFAGLAAFVVLMASCKKDSDVFNITTGSFGVGGLTASTSNLTLNANAVNDTAITFKWPAANFGDKPVVTYTLQLDVPSDTSGTSAWANAKSYPVGNNILTYGFVTKALNDLLTTMNLPTGTANAISIRIKSDVPQYNGSASSVPSAYSNTVTLKITTYLVSLFIPGAYQNWDPTTAPLLNPVTGKPGLYEAYEYMPGTGIQYFKYTNAPDWNHINYGDAGNGLISVDGNAGGMYVSDGGYVEVTANFNTNTWTATKTTWGILGDATPGGWTTDTQLTYDVANQVWKVTAAMKASGSFKFRANNAWVIDFGIDANGNLQYADNPFFGYNSTINNITVPTDGNYTITLDLHVSGKYSYTLKKN